MDITLRNIKTYLPMNNNKRFYLDTNVLYWYCYPRYSTVLTNFRRTQIQPYYDFVDRLVQNGNPILTSVYNISELLNVVEKNEYRIYQKLHEGISVNLKDLRNMGEERKKLKSTLRIALNNVYETCNIVGNSIRKETFNKFVDELESHRCDFFDYLSIVDNVLNENLAVITDDEDFSSISQIEICTANERMLNECN